MRLILGIAVTALALTASPGTACLWDSDTLEDEIAARPGMAKAILDEAAPPVDRARLEARIARLRAEPREDDAKWWNELAASHIQLGDTAEGARLLEGVLGKFWNDYAIHANLGTAYHLLGNYQRAIPRIARGLEIDPNAHFGLERFHLALLRYLAESDAYRRDHVYVDEWSLYFAVPEYPTCTACPATDTPAEMLKQLASTIESEARYANPPQPVSADREEDWRRARRVAVDGLANEGLAADPKFAAGVLYMAKLNRREPAAMVMLGLASLASGDLNLAVRAFERAIALGSPQTDHLRRWITAVNDFICQSGGEVAPARL